MQFNIIVFNTFKKGFELVENIIFGLSGYRLEAAFSEIRSQEFSREKIPNRSITIRMLPSLSAFHELFRINTYFLFIRAKKGFPLVMKVPCNTGYIL